MVIGTRVNYTYEIHGSKAECETMAEKIIALADFVRDNNSDRNSDLVKRLTALRDAVKAPDAIHEHKPGDPAFSQYCIDGTHVLEIPFVVNEYEKTDRVSATWSYLGDLFEKTADWMLTYCTGQKNGAFMKLGVFEFIGFSRFMARILSKPITDDLKAKIREAKTDGKRMPTAEMGELLHRALFIVQYGDNSERETFGYDIEYLLKMTVENSSTKKEK